MKYERPRLVRSQREIVLVLPRRDLNLQGRLAVVFGRDQFVIPAISFVLTTFFVQAFPVGTLCGLLPRVLTGFLFFFLAACQIFTLLFAATLLLYLQTLAPSVATLFDDSLEFPLVAHDLAIAHPTGYPLYTLLGKLFTLGPFPNVAWAVNLLSAAVAALTVSLVYLVARMLTRRRWPALLGALALAASPVFWSQAVVAEVYTLNAALVAALLWLALRWARRTFW